MSKGRTTPGSRPPYPGCRGRLAVLVVAAMLVAPACSDVSTQAQPRAAAGDPAADALMLPVEELASPRYAGRRTGTEGGRAARAYIRAAFADAGLEPAGTNGFEQPFRFPDHDDAANLIAIVRGTNADARAIVVTAHYDHLGIRNGATYHGADDNASGVSALLALARTLKARPLPRTVMFAALDAEEVGLEGAKAFVARPPIPLARIALNVNLDMLARSDRNEIFAAGTYHYPWLAPPLQEVGRRAGVSLRFGHDRPGTGTDDWTLQSDHGVFHKAGIPFVYFGVEDHPDYHRPTDTADKIDPAFFRRVVDMLIDALTTLDRAM